MTKAFQMTIFLLLISLYFNNPIFGADHSALDTPNLGGLNEELVNFMKIKGKEVHTENEEQWLNITPGIKDSIDVAYNMETWFSILVGLRELEVISQQRKDLFEKTKLEFPLQGLCLTTWSKLNGLGNSVVISDIYYESFDNFRMKVQVQLPYESREYGIPHPWAASQILSTPRSFKVIKGKLTLVEKPRVKESVREMYHLGLFDKKAFSIWNLDLQNATHGFKLGKVNNSYWYIGLRKDVVLISFNRKVQSINMIRYRPGLPVLAGGKKFILRLEEVLKVEFSFLGGATNVKYSRLDTNLGENLAGAFIFGKLNSGKDRRKLRNHKTVQNLIATYWASTPKNEDKVLSDSIAEWVTEEQSSWSNDDTFHGLEASEVVTQLAIIAGNMDACEESLSRIKTCFNDLEILPAYRTWLLETYKRSEKLKRDQIKKLYMEELKNFYSESDLQVDVLRAHLTTSIFPTELRKYICSLLREKGCDIFYTVFPNGSEKVTEVYPDGRVRNWSLVKRPHNPDGNKDEMNENESETDLRLKNRGFTRKDLINALIKKGYSREDAEKAVGF